MSLYANIYDIVRKIPAGSVTSYGRIAKLANTGPRQVGYAMAAIPDNLDVPWHRVVNSKGEISARKNGNGDSRQRRLLIEEGVVFDKNERIDLKKYAWVEDESSVWPEDFPDDLKI